jgi:membrane protein YqaA with SNARE-associated domain
VSLLTGFASAAGTVAETDTILAAVGKLDGNIALRATTASLYPYIGGKLLTYLDEEAAIDDPLISAGDIYRKTAGGVDYVNPDNVPSLDLRFATDKTLTARRGPTPTFSRASSGTFVNANGLIVGKTAGTTSSITPNTQAIGSQVTVTVASGSVVGWVVGQAISLIVDTDGQDDPDSTELWLLGNIVSTTDTTLVFSVTSRTAQAGSATSWTLGYRGPRFDHDPVSRTNLLSRSAEFENSAWSRAAVGVAAATITPNSDIAPDGTTTADTANFSATTATNQQGMLFRTDLTATIGQVVTFSVYMRVPSGTATVYIELAEGSPVSGQSVACNVTTTWQRFSITRAAVAATQIYTQIGPDTRSFAGQPAVQPAASVLLWGAQLEVGSFPTSYIPTTTAPVTIHDCRGLLIEEGRTNLVADSNSFNNWGQSNSTVATSSVATPEGTADAWKVVEDLLLNTHTVSRAFIPVSGTTYTASVWLKPAENGFAFVGFVGGGFFSTFISVNLSTGAVSTALGTPIGASSVSHSNGWWRVSFSLAATASLSSNIDIRLSRDGNWANRSYLGNGVNGMYVYGAQVEAGSFPTSYIPTTTGTLARSVDVCNITGGNFNNFYNQSEGTLFADVSGLMTDVLGGNRGFAMITDGTYANAFGILKTANVGFIRAEGNTGNVSQFILGNAYAPFTQYKVALGVKTNDTNAAFNGSLRTTDTSVTLPSTMNRLEFRDATGAAGGQPSCHIAAIRYYRKRLPNAKLQALTV